jgi:formylglycine-generating enzyme required for sulfatase activity
MLSGHGQQFASNPKDKTKEDAYFCPSDAVSRDPNTLVSLSYLTDVLLDRVGTGLLLVDACRNAPRKSADKGSRDPQTPEVGESKGVQGGDDVRLKAGQSVLFSCRAAQMSYEDKGPSSTSLFTSCVLEALSGKGASGDEVTWAGVVAHVTARMASDEIRKKIPAGEQQEPISAGQVGHIVLGRRKNALRKRPALLIAPFTPAQAKARQQEWAEYLGLPGVVDSRTAGGLPLVLIPPGEFLMGSHESADQTLAFAKQTGWDDAKLEYFADEHPRHKVRISEPFWVGRHEVTRGEFAKFVAQTGYTTEAERDGQGGWGLNKQTGSTEQGPQFSWREVGWTYNDNHPVVNVTWNDAERFVSWLNNEFGGGFRLLWEAEWEYCARAGSQGRYPHSDDPELLAKFDNVLDGTFAEERTLKGFRPIKAKDGYVFTAPVETYPANAFGLRDMLGNVAEWCADTYDAQIYGQRQGGVVNDPRIDDPQASYRVFRGGSWYNRAVDCRSALRSIDEPGARYSYLGFRVVRSSEQ